MVWKSWREMALQGLLAYIVLNTHTHASPKWFISMTGYVTLDKLETCHKSTLATTN